MGANKRLHADYAHMQEAYLTDIDCSGGLYLEMQERHKQKLKITITNFGYFYKAELDGKEITKEHFYNIIGYKENLPLRLEHHVHVFESQNKIRFNVEVSEINVS